MLQQKWEDLPGVRSRGNVPFPFEFSLEELEEIAADCKGAALAMELMCRVKHTKGDLFPDRGPIWADRYDEAKDALNEQEKEAWPQSWPFHDLPLNA